MSTANMLSMTYKEGSDRAASGSPVGKHAKGCEGVGLWNRVNLNGTGFNPYRAYAIDCKVDRSITDRAGAKGRHKEGNLEWGREDSEE